jgi:hypothetical protein
VTVEGLGGRTVIVDMKDKTVRKQVEIFGRLCATQEEMADYFDCSLSTIEKYMTQKDPENISEFLRVYKRQEAEAKTSLRRMQMKKAIGGDNTLLIWLGKQLLGQRDKSDLETKNKNTNIEEKDQIDLSKLTDEEFNLYEQLLEKTISESEADAE